MGFLDKTQCPNCREETFIPVKRDGKVYRTDLPVRGVHDGPGIVVGAPTLNACAKVCVACGFVGLFSVTMLKDFELCAP